jgi:hypothetical protein
MRPYYALASLPEGGVSDPLTGTPLQGESGPTKKLDVVARNTSISIEPYFRKISEICQWWVNYYITCNIRRTSKALGYLLYRKFYFGLVRRLRHKRGLRLPNNRLSRRRMSSYIGRTYQGIWRYRTGLFLKKWYILRRPKTMRTNIYPLYAPPIVRLNITRVRQGRGSARPSRVFPGLKRLQARGLGQNCVYTIHLPPSPFTQSS